MAERLLTKSEVADRYKVAPYSVDRWEKLGKIPARLPGWIGKEPRWLESEIDAHLLSMRCAEKQEQVA